MKMTYLTAALLGGCALGPGQSEAAPLLPDFAAATFTGAVAQNPFFPLDFDGTRVIVAEGVDEDGVPFNERSEQSVAGPGRTILGIQTTAIRDRAYEDGVLVEDTFDYFATDTAGNVWYMGEDVVNYRYDADGTFLGTDNASAWIAGINGALPGWIMPGAPVPGLNYYQEYAAADAALDQGRIEALGETLTIAGVGVFDDVLVTFEGTELDPEARELNDYATGFGLIRVEEGLGPDLTDPDAVFELQPAAVPLPASLTLVLVGIGALGLAARRRG